MAGKIDWGLIDPFLGTNTDSAIARRFGVGRHTVELRRRRLGVPAFTATQPKSPEFWTTVDALLANGEPFESICRKFSIRPSSLTRRKQKLGLIKAKKKRIDWSQIDPLLGAAPDTEIAERFQISQTSVSDRRKSLKIAVFKNTPTL